MNSTWNLGIPLVKAQVAMLWHSVLNQVRTSKDQTIIYSSFSTHVSGMHERLSHFILCIQSCSLLSPEWLFTTVAGKSAWGWNCVVWGCKMDRQQEKKPEEHRGFAWYSLRRKLLHPQRGLSHLRFIFLTFLHLSNSLTASGWGFFWAGVLIGAFVTCSIKLL